jgi:hypothetical protein
VGRGHLRLTAQAPLGQGRADQEGGAGRDPAELAGLPEVARYAALSRAMAERAGPLVGVLLAAARAGERELQTVAATIDRERLAGATALATHLAETGALARASRSSAPAT